MIKKKLLARIRRQVALLMAGIIFFSLPVNTKQVEAANYNSEQQKVAKSLNAVGYNFKFDDNYANFPKNYSTNNSNKTYYFSSSTGDDKNDGLSAAKPKKSPDYYFKKNNINIMLKGGDTFVLKYSSMVGSNVNIDSYGTGRAIVDYSYKNSMQMWDFDVKKHLYSTRIDKFVGNDMGHLIIDGKTYYKKQVKYNIWQDGEYHYNKDQKRLIIQSNTNLAGKWVYVTLPCTAFVFLGSQNSSIQNIEIKNAGVHGIDIHNSSNILVNNCYVHHIGGAIKSNRNAKYGNGIQVWATGVYNIKICNNIVSDCFDAGITAQIGEPSTTSSGIYFANNVVRNCNYGFEFFQYKSSPVKNVVVTNNVFYDIKDITGGYRYTVSSTDYTSAFCLWYSDNPQTSVTIQNNIAYCGSYYGIAYGYDKTQDVYKFSNNKILVENEKKKVKFGHNYYGTNAQFKVTSEVPNFGFYKNIVEGIMQ